MKARLVPALALIAVAGCAKLHVEKSYTLEVFQTRSIEVGAPTSEQKIKITVTSDEPITVSVILDKDLPPGGASKDDFDPGMLKTGVLASEKNVKDGTLSVTIPGKEKYAVYLSGAKKKAQVTVKIDGV